MYTRRVSDPLAVAVDCYAGAQGDETPRRVTRKDQRGEILAVVAQWRTPDHWYFRVRTVAVRPARCDRMCDREPGS